MYHINRVSTYLVHYLSNTYAMTSPIS